jgi:hypothetical protein
MATNKRDLKAYSRFDGTGRIVPGSTVLRRNKPKNGNWKQVQAYECCDTFSTCKQPLVMEIIPFNLFYEFGFRVNDPNNVKGTIDWGDGNTQTFNLSNDPGYTYFGHNYSTPDYIPKTVKVLFDNLTGFDNLEIGDTDGWKVLSVTNLPTVFAGTSIEQVDADESLLTSLDVSGLPIKQLYALNCPNLTYLNVEGCTQLNNTQLFGDAFEILNFEGCVNLSSADLYDNPNLTTIIIDGCSSLQYLYAADCILTEANVDYIIETLDGFGLEDGQLDLGGSGNSAPSAGVAGNITSLTSKGWSVTTN